MRPLHPLVAVAAVLAGGHHTSAQTLDGRIADWPPGQTGQLLVVLDGSFRLSFPPLKAMAQLPVVRTFDTAYQTTTLFCPEATSSPRGAAPNGVHYSLAQLDVTRADGKSLGQLELRSSAASYTRPGLVSSMLLFVSQPVALHGTVRCPDQEVQFDLDLPAGFTSVAQEILTVHQGVVTRRFTRTSPSPRAWYLGDTAARTGLSMDAAGDGDGVLVTEVRAGSPADQAGIPSGSRIVMVDGVDVRRASLSKLFALLVGPQGSRVTVKVMVPGQDTPVSVTLHRR